MKAINNYTKITITATIILLFMLAVVWTGSALGVSKRNLKRVDKEGPVEITAIYLNPLEKAGDSELRFEVKLDTHSVDLEQYELKEISFIRAGSASRSTSPDVLPVCFTTATTYSPPSISRFSSEATSTPLPRANPIAAT